MSRWTVDEFKTLTEKALKTAHSEGERKIIRANYKAWMKKNACPTCGRGMLRQFSGGPLVCVNCGATIGGSPYRGPMRREVRVRRHARRSE